MTQESRKRKHTESDFENETKTPDAKRMRFTSESKGFHTLTQANSSYVTQTPGQEIANKQAELFSKDYFVKCIGEDNMKPILKKLGDTIDEQNKAWNLLSDTSIPFDDSKKRDFIKRINPYLSKLTPTDGVDRLIAAISRCQTAFKEVPEIRLQEHLMKYLINTMKYKDSL